MLLLKVWIRTATGITAHLGYLACGDADTSGRFQAQFAYSEDWRSDADSFDLLPRSLPRTEVTEAAPATAYNLEPPLAVFEDAIPDTWGRKLLIHLRKLKQSEQGLPYLLREIGSDGLGALSFGVGEANAPPPRDPAMIALLPQLLQATEDFERGRIENLTPPLERLLMAGATPGGARPKAVVVDDAGAGWIAKLPSGRDKEGEPGRGIQEWDIVGLEATAMSLARASGLDVPETRLARVGTKKVLLVRRFDINGGGRNHMVSFKTLCEERPGSHTLRYRDLYGRLLDASCRPDADVEMFYRHMVFNAAIGNTDDHLKNFWMIRDEEGWKLSPAIDLVPAGLNRREHQLTFLYDYRCPTGGDLIEVARHWRIHPPKARRIVESVIDSVRTFESAAEKLDVRTDNLLEIGGDIHRRLELLAKNLQPAAKPGNPRPNG